MFKKLEQLYNRFSNDIGIDLGTANTLVYLRGHGIVITEPSVVAVNIKTDQVVAVGVEAKKMLGRTPGHIKAVRPIVDGVISDYEITEEMLGYFINKAEKISKKVFRPRVVVGIPSDITNVEMRAVVDASRSAGAREVYIVEEPMAAAIGIRMPVKEPVGTMIVDIGGGTTDIAVISLGGIVQSKSMKIAGDKLNQDIMNYLKDEFKLLVGEKTAEHVKITIGSVSESQNDEVPVRGRDLISGLPREVIITAADVREAISESVNLLIDGIKEVLETTPPEILSDVMRRGIILVGGGALTDGLPGLLEALIKIPIRVSDDPLTAVARGTGIILEDVDFYKESLVPDDYELQIR
jgi:rod shape-determining protein MreB